MDSKTKLYQFVPARTWWEGREGSAWVNDSMQQIRPIIMINVAHDFILNLQELKTSLVRIAQLVAKHLKPSAGNFSKFLRFLTSLQLKSLKSSRALEFWTSVSYGGSWLIFSAEITVTFRYSWLFLRVKSLLIYAVLQSRVQLKFSGPRYHRGKTAAVRKS